MASCERNSFSMTGNDDAVDEQDLILCCALCCANISVYPTVDCFGCSGTVRFFDLNHSTVLLTNISWRPLNQTGLCCINLQCCCKGGAPCLVPFACLGMACDHYEEGCNFVNAQCHCCCWVTSLAIPCNDEVPMAVALAGLTLYPKLGCCIKQGEIMNRE